MIKVIDDKLWKDSQKVGWIDGIHVRDMSNAKLGYFENNFIYNQQGHKVAYIHENQLMFENGNTPISLEHINQEIQGTLPLFTKCAVYVLIEE